MTPSDSPSESGVAPSFLGGNSPAASLIRQVDWSRTPVGAMSEWPQALKTVLGVMLHSRQPMFLWWGPDLIQFYNDAYIPSFGEGKHPKAMGQRGEDCWREIWPIISPQIDDVMSRGLASWNEDHLVPIFRNGRIEDVYWTYGYSPVWGDGDPGRVVGTLVVCTETTAQVVANRRQEVLRALGSKVAQAPPDMDVPQLARGLLAGACADVPTALFYRQSATGIESAWPHGLGLGVEVSRLADLSIRAALESAPEHLQQLALGAPVLLLGVVDIADARWPEPVRDIFLVRAQGARGQAGLDFVAYGLNPRIPLDRGYRHFLTQLTGGVSLATARSDAAKIHAIAELERNTLFMQAPVATAVLIGPDAVFQLANPLYCQIVGRTDLVGKSYAEAFPELAGTELPGMLRKVYLTGEGYCSPETRTPLDLTGGGTVQDRYFQFNLQPMRTFGGTVYGLMAVAIDVTSQVLARQAVEQVNEERAQLLERAELTSRAKDEFLAMLGHELRNPLSPIVTALHVMRSRGDSVTRTEQSTIQRQVDHLVRLVDDLLDISSITRGKVRLKPSHTSLPDILGKAVEMVGDLMVQRRHAFTVDIRDDGPAWWGDAARLAQVVSNLLTNAARYTPPGGRVDLVATGTADEIELRVKDNGIGISPELLPHVFDMFFQGRQGADRAEGGLGLGLALVKTLVALHRGTVEARSGGAGAGSEFVVRLPRGHGDPDRETPVGAPMQAGPGRRRRVLLVDDNRDAAESLAELLRMDGHEVQLAFEPLAGLAIAEQFKPEVAILDIGLPGMDGHELALLFKERFAEGQCRLIALTGYGQANDRERSVAAGFALHLVKPVDIDQLLDAVRSDGSAGGARRRDA